jgi:DNA polymerase-1
MYSLKPQFGYFQEFLEILGIAWTREPGVEADDYIATLCKTATEPVIVLSADHDLLQLVSDTVTVLRPSQGRTPEVMYTPEAVMAKYGLPPDKLAQMWAIMGDTGDGIIGIPKVGPVTATKMILKYGTLSDTLANEEKCNGYERIVRDNYRMIVLDGSVAKLPDGLNLSFDPGYPSELRRYFERFELNSLIRRFDLQRLWMQDEKDQ